MEEASSELYKQILQTPETFRRSRDVPELLPVKRRQLISSDELMSEIAETDASASQYELSDSELLQSEGMAPEVRAASLDQTAFITPVSLRSEEAAPRSTMFWVGSSGSEAIPPGGSIPEGTSLVTVPGKGSLSVIGPTGRGGAKPESRLNTVASERRKPPTSEVRHEVHRTAGGEVFSPEGLSQFSAGSRVIRDSAIVLVTTIVTSTFAPGMCF